MPSDDAHEPPSALVRPDDLPRLAAWHTYSTPDCCDDRYIDLVDSETWFYAEPDMCEVLAQTTRSLGELERAGDLVLAPEDLPRLNGVVVFANPYPLGAPGMKPGEQQLEEWVMTEAWVKHLAAAWPRTRDAVAHLQVDSRDGAPSVVSTWQPPVVSARWTATPNALLLSTCSLFPVDSASEGTDQSVASLLLANWKPASTHPGHASRNFEPPTSLSEARRVMTSSTDVRCLTSHGSQRETQNPLTDGKSAQFIVAWHDGTLMMVGETFLTAAIPWGRRMRLDADLLPATHALYSGDDLPPVGFQRRGLSTLGVSRDAVVGDFDLPTVDALASVAALPPLRLGHNFFSWLAAMFALWGQTSLPPTDAHVWGRRTIRNVQQAADKRTSDPNGREVLVTTLVDSAGRAGSKRDAAGRTMRRHVVRGHFRRQWYASLQTHRAKWIAAHLRGGSKNDKPVKMPRRVYAVRPKEAVKHRRARAAAARAAKTAKTKRAAVVDVSLPPDARATRQRELF